MKIEEVLNKYDKLLSLKKNMDGSKEVFRQSPYNVERQHTLFVIENQFSGSCKWLRKRLMEMDTTRNDIVGSALRDNWKKRSQRADNRMTQDIADYFHTGGEIFIN